MSILFNDVTQITDVGDITDTDDVLLDQVDKARRTSVALLGEKIKENLALDGLDIDDVSTVGGTTINGALNILDAYLNDKEVASYADALALTPADWPEGSKIQLTNAGISGEFYVRSGTISDSSTGCLLSDSTWSAASKYLARPIKEGVILSSWFGHVADWNGTTGTDAAAPINAATLFARNNLALGWHTVVMIPGRSAIEAGVIKRQAVSLYGAGTLGGSNGGTELVCNFSAGTIATPPSVPSGERFTPVLDYTPMFYNNQLLTQSGFGNFRLNGNNKDVYGLWFHEFYYMDMMPIFIVSCNKRPLTMAVGQFNELAQITYNANLAGGALIGCDTTSIAGIDTESNSITGSQLDIVSDVSTKSGVTVNHWHHEEGAAVFPTILGKISGRFVNIKSANIQSSAANAAHYLEFIGVESYTWDGSTFNTIAAIGCTADDMSFSLSNVSIQLDSGAVGNYMKVSSTSNVVDNSASPTNQIDPMTGAPRLPRATTITNSDGSSFMLEFTDDDNIRLFGDNDMLFTRAGSKYSILNNGGNITIDCTGTLQALSDTAVDINVNGSNSAQFDNSTTSGDTRMLLTDHTGSQRRVIVDGSGFLKLA